MTFLWSDRKWSRPAHSCNKLLDFPWWHVLAIPKNISDQTKKITSESSPELTKKNISRSKQSWTALKVMKRNYLSCSMKRSLTIREVCYRADRLRTDQTDLICRTICVTMRDWKRDRIMSSTKIRKQIFPTETDKERKTYKRKERQNNRNLLISGCWHLPFPCLNILWKFVHGEA